MIPDCPFARLLLEEREAIIAFCKQRMGWTEAAAVQELEGWDHVAIAYLRRDMIEARGCGGHVVEHDPGAEMFNLR